MKRKSVVPAAVLFSFTIVGAVAGIYGIISLNILVMILSLAWVALGMLIAFLSNFIFNRNR